ncbi:unnamed protein product, partial [Cyprideis torosa]
MSGPRRSPSSAIGTGAPFTLRRNTWSEVGGSILGEEYDQKGKWRLLSLPRPGLNSRGLVPCSKAGPHPEVFFRVAEGIRRGLEEWRAQLAQQATEKTADKE